MIPERYCFEGEAPVKCSRCGVKHMVSFSGINPMSIEQAIEEALEADGWGVASMVCADCFDPEEERRALDAEIEDEYDANFLDYDDEDDYMEEDE